MRAASGVGAIASAFFLGHGELPRRCVTVMFCAWAPQSGLLIGYALATGLLRAFAAISLPSGGLSAVANVVWGR